MEYSASGERLLEVASQLFYTEGIGAIGVDRVAEESGVSKPTLYAQFKNKAGLAAAVLQRRSDNRVRTITAYIDALPADEPSKVLALFDFFIQGHTKPGFRGCPFTNAAAELPDGTHPARIVISEYKAWMRSLLTQLAEDDGLDNPAWWGSTLMLLIDGANARVITTSDANSMKDARQSAEVMLVNAQTPTGSAEILKEECQ